MSGPVWILERVALAAHARVLIEHGARRSGHDPVRLSMALAWPRTVLAFAGGRASVFDVAAAYAAGITRLRPFREANAATACLLAMLFLRLNGVELPAPLDEKHGVFAEAGRGALDRVGIAHWMKMRRIANRHGGKGTVYGLRVRDGRVERVAMLRGDPARQPTRRSKNARLGRKPTESSLPPPVET
ncbi:MAG: hypothetical protein JSW68_00530 [Burkholderiales bacterium]|nr:MAG: hypothetical protein JSW68_00530 [Burkholderiales bacterium]